MHRLSAEKLSIAEPTVDLANIRLRR